MESKDEIIDPEQIYRRKIELIKRDPLTDEWNDLWEKNTLLEEGNKKLEKAGCPGLNEPEYGRGEKIARKIEQKWNVSLIRTNNSDEKLLSGLKISAYPTPTVYDATQHIEERLIPLAEEVLTKEKEYILERDSLENDLREKYSQEKDLQKRYSLGEYLVKMGLREKDPQKRDRLERRGWIFFPTEGGYERGNCLKKFYIPILEGHIPIIIDPGGARDIKKVLGQVKSILNKRIKEQKSNISNQWKPLPQTGDASELGFIYSSNEKIFYKYLRWYDLKIKGNLPFRIIAFFESNISDDEKRQEVFSAKKNIGSIGCPVKGESNVRIGFIRIYRAIFRKPPPSKELDIQGEKHSRLSSFDCPDHPGNSCPGRECKHLNKFKLLFDSQYPEDLQ